MTHFAKSIKILLDRPQPERRLGPFELLEQLGRGGFAPVWLAREIYGSTALRAAAVKLFPLREATDGDGERIAVNRQQIVEEARALCRVEHPSVVRFYALPIDEDLGVIGLAMEHVAGTSLDRRLASQGSLSVAETIAIGTAVASALAAVHHAGLVHRDVKPGNVIETADVYKLIDFGIAAAEPKRPMRLPGLYTLRLDDFAASALGEKMSSIEGIVVDGATFGATMRVDVVCGTVGYIDPTCVATGAPATAASDLYALGAMLFQCLVGKVPIAACAPPNKLKGDIADGRAAAPPLQSLRPDVPNALAQLIDSLLIPDQAQRTSSAEWVATRLAQIQTEIAGVRRALPPEDVGPFRGLGRYNERDRDVYFGRSSEIASALEILRSRGLVALIGPSGSGKSSLARAGILPAVIDGALGGWPKHWDAATVEPGHDPRASLGASLHGFVPNAGSMSPEAVVVALAERAKATGWGVILLVDQLEELATLAQAAERAWAAALLTRMGERTLPGVRLVVTARRDMLDPLLGVGDLGTVLVRRSLLIEPINEIVWGDVLDQALTSYGYSFEDDALRSELLADLKASADAMPHVQFALAQLWSTRDTATKRLTRAGLRAIGGGIAGALERHADATLEILRGAHGDGGVEAARKMLLALTTPQGTRTTLARSSLLKTGGAKGEDAVQMLEEARLITPGIHGMTLAHEALLTRWGTLRSWVAEAREGRLLVAELENDAARWRAAPKVTPLWMGYRLRVGDQLYRRREYTISEDGVAFLKASRHAELRRKLTTAGSVALAGMALLGAAVAYVSGLRSEQEKTRAALAEEKRSREAAVTSQKEAEQQRQAAVASQEEAELRAQEVRSKESEIVALVNRFREEQDKGEQRKLERQIRSKLQDMNETAKEKTRRPEAPETPAPTAATPVAPAPPAPTISAPQPQTKPPEFKRGLLDPPP